MALGHEVLHKEPSVVEETVEILGHRVPVVLLSFFDEKNFRLIGTTLATVFFLMQNDLPDFLRSKIHFILFFLTGALHFSDFPQWGKIMLLSFSSVYASQVFSSNHCFKNKYSIQVALINFSFGLATKMIRFSLSENAGSLSFTETACINVTCFSFFVGALLETFVLAEKQERARNCIIVEKVIASTAKLCFVYKENLEGNKLKLELAELLSKFRGFLTEEGVFNCQNGSHPKYSDDQVKEMVKLATTRVKEQKGDLIKENLNLIKKNRLFDEKAQKLAMELDEAKKLAEAIHKTYNYEMERNAKYVCVLKNDIVKLQKALYEGDAPVQLNTSDHTALKIESDDSDTSQVF